MASERIQRQIDRLLDEAEQAVKSHDWDVVSARAQSVPALDPSSADALTFSSAAPRSLGDSPAESVAPIQAAHTTPVLPTAPTEQPTSFASGRYRVREFLGEGGRKRVYKTHDRPRFEGPRAADYGAEFRYGHLRVVGNTPLIPSVPSPTQSGTKGGWHASWTGNGVRSKTGSDRAAGFR